MDKAAKKTSHESKIPRKAIEQVENNIIIKSTGNLGLCVRKNDLELEEELND